MSLVRDNVTAGASRQCQRPIVVLSVLLLAILTLSAQAGEVGGVPRRAWTCFAQAGFAEHDTQSYVFGVTWSLDWRRYLAAGALTADVEASGGRWSTETVDGTRSSWNTQLGITPAFRLRPTAWGGRWYLEAGIGFNVIVPLYRNPDKHFSTEFNFGDRIAFGRSLGVAENAELSLRLEHFSNAGIDHPNPGENFFQLRYAHRL